MWTSAGRECVHLQVMQQPYLVHYSNAHQITFQLWIYFVFFVFVA
jgi:hypothetical protein